MNCHSACTRAINSFLTDSSAMKGLSKRRAFLEWASSSSSSPPLSTAGFSMLNLASIAAFCSKFLALVNGLVKGVRVGEEEKR